MAEFPRDYQILVADDASTDKTSEVLTPYARVLPLTVVRSEQRRGYAASLEMLLREAVRRSEYPKRDMVITIQADFSQEPEEVVAMIKTMEAGADIVCGESALTPDTAWKIRWSRGIAAKLLRRKSVPQGIKDPFTGYRAYRVFTVKKAIDERAGGRLLLHDGWASNAELLALTAPHARRVEALDVTVRPHRLQRESRLQPWPALRNVWNYARKAKPEIEAASVMELDDVVASGSTNRSNDVASVRERMSERSDMHGNRSPHGDRQPHNARPERQRYERGGPRDRDASGGRGQSSDRPRAERPERTERPERPRQERSAQSQSRPQAENPRKQAERKPAEARKPREPRPPREPRQRQNGERQTRTPQEIVPTAEIEAVDGVLPIAENGEPALVEQASGEPTKRRRRRGRRSRGGVDAVDARSENGRDGDRDRDRDGNNSNNDNSNDNNISNNGNGDNVVSEDAAERVEVSGEAAAVVNGDGTPVKKRRRGRRGGRGRRRQNTVTDGTAADGAAENFADEGTSSETEQPGAVAVRQDHDDDA